MTHVITRSCCTDAACVPVCPVDCIHPRPDERGFGETELLHIDATACVDCGACHDVCPTGAIIPDHGLDAATAPYLGIAADYFRQTAPAPPPPVAVPPVAVPDGARPVPRISGPLRVAIVGTGPSACYAAMALAAVEGIDVHISMFERLPVFGGLIRHGVAPDHQPTKGAAEAFERAIARAGVRLFLNVDVGVHVSHADLLTHHHAIIYAVGMAGDRRMGIPGENLAGSHSAAEFVGWYNGHPDFAGRDFDFSGERAVIIGNGNVALDVARILTSDAPRLEQTDIAEHALQALRRSRIRDVFVIGRRGPMQTAATSPELLALGNMPGVDIAMDAAGILDTATGVTEPAAQGLVAGRKMSILAGYARRPSGPGRRRITFKYLRSPVAIDGNGRVEAVRLMINGMSAGTGSASLGSTDEEEILSCGLVIRSIGYEASAFPPAAFDPAHHAAFNIGGRVTDGGRILPGCYVAGWIKRGPNGGIGANKPCSAETVAALLDDFRAGRLARPSNGTDDLDRLILDRRPERIGLNGWQAIDLFERTSARRTMRTRIKLTDVAQMLSVAAASRPPAR